jgi:2C-methyl-D-erythritol 2,4-cyclodiphosphate synthase
MSHPVLEGKPNANHVRARIRTHVHSDYIFGHHHIMLEINSKKVLNYIKIFETSVESYISIVLNINIKVRSNET